jgi:hypothetical protein
MTCMVRGMQSSVKSDRLFVPKSADKAKQVWQAAKALLMQIQFETLCLNTSVLNVRRWHANADMLRWVVGLTGAAAAPGASGACHSR